MPAPPLSDLTSFEKDFCGGVFWDNALSWNTDVPDLTPCFQKVILSWLPPLVLAILTPLEVRACFTSPNRNVPWSWVSVGKVLGTCGLVGVTAAELALLASSDESRPDVDYVTTSLALAAFLLSLLLQLLCMRYGRRTSAAQFYFYLLATVSGGVILRSIVKQKKDPKHYEGYGGSSSDLGRLTGVYSAQFALSTVLLILNFLPDATPTIYEEKYARLDKPCPKIGASYFSKIFYFWSDRLLWRGYRNPLTPEDLWQVDPKFTSRGVVPIFDSHYERSVREAAANGKKHSVYPALFWTFGPMFFAGAAQKFVYDVMAMVSPQLMNLMIDYVESYALGDDDYSWKGYFYAAAMLVTMCVQTLILSQYFERMFLVGMNLRTAVISVIYRKSLRMSSSAKRESTVGEIVNLMSVDVQRFMDLLPYINMIW